MKHHILPILIFLVLLPSCSTDEGPSLTILNGRTMGTTYQVSYSADQLDPGTTQMSIDSLLVAFNESVSTYIPTSLISSINADTDTSKWHPLDEYFVMNLISATTIYESTQGAFNPAVGPLVEAYGFGVADPQPLTSAQVDSLKALIDFEAFVFDPANAALKKAIPGARLDFSALAKGMGVDLVGDYLENKGVTDYFIEIGGEVRTRGMHPDARPWRLGIDRPEENPNPDQRPLQAIIPLTDHAVATSGNYRNFYVKDGKKYVHTINPETGYPEISNVLSVSVIAPTCWMADGYATAFMVMGLDKALDYVESSDELEAYFITAGDDGAFIETMSAGFPKKLEEDL